MFTEMLISQRNTAEKQTRRLDSGLKKLVNAEQQVSLLKEEIAEKKPFLEQVEKEMSAMAERIKKDTEEAEKARQVVSLQEEQAQQTADHAKQLKEETSQELNKVEPELNKAMHFLKDIDPRDFTTVKTFANPHKNVE